MSETNVSGIVKQATQSLSDMSSEISTKMDALKTKEGGLDPNDLLEMQFMMSKYTSFVETVSNVQKSIMDTMKSLAQKV